MKKTLRNLMLAGAAALLATGANAQALTEVWKLTTGVPGSASGGTARFATAKDGKIIANDYGAKKLIELTETGAKDYFDYSEALDAQYGEDVVYKDQNGADSVVHEVPSPGPAVAVDDAGNFLIAAAGAGSSTPNYLIISADFESSYKLQIEMPEGVAAGRMDQCGKIVGDMLSSEGAYLWLCPQGSTAVAIIKVVEGAQDVDYSSASGTVSVTMNSSTIAQPALWTVEEIDALANDLGDQSPSFWSRNRGSAQNIYGWNEDASEQTILKLTETDANGVTTAGAGAEGFATFKLQDVTYFAVPMSLDGKNRSGAFGVYDETGKLHAVYGNPEGVTTGMGQMGAVIAEPVDENSVNIYRFIPGVMAVKATFSTIETGIEGVEVEENAEAVYYNLQGVKVANPANGAFIKVQGGKASKVLVK